MTEEFAVEADKLTKVFSGFVAVDGVTFRVRRGEVFGFLGSNGAGKSTTIRMLCGILQPTEGSGRVLGYDIATQPEEIKKRIGYMSQKFSLYRELTVEENLEFFAGVYGVPVHRVRGRKEEILQQMDLVEQRHLVTDQFPGGWKQRLALGCATLHRPPILFLDEPTSGVDPIARRQFWDLIYQLSEEGTTVFVTTHYMDEAEYCDRLALMHAGRIIAMDTPDSLRDYVTSDTFLRLSSSNSLEALRLLEGRPEFLDVSVFGGDLHLRVRDQARAREVVQTVLTAEQIDILGLEVIQPEMEDVFVSLIEQESEK
ncbi:MAG TPA: ABC transporter ATP-binding protein [Acidobacteriota bacterium]|nr:ABC transporter ATP-binding protein [Acidobacteriota bacterium]